MEFIVPLGLFLLITVLLPWINLSRISSLRDEIDALRSEVRQLRGGEALKPSYRPRTYSDTVLASPDQRTSTPQPDNNIKARPTTAVPLATSNITHHSDNPADFTYRYSPIEEEDDDNAPESHMEFNLGAKLPVWIGAISLICAAYFLVKYSLESGLLGPMARISIGIISGLAMTIAGHAIARRTHISNYKRISQGLTGAGIVSLYGCLYGAVNLYGIIPPTMGFIGMCAVTVIAIISSIRIGQPIAVFALIGGLLTPALMNSATPNNLLLFLYLFMLFSGLTFVMLRGGWWILSLLSLLGVFSWTSFWLLTSFNPDESSYMLLMLVGVIFTVFAQSKRHILSAPSDTKAEFHGYPHLLTGAAIAGTALTIGALSFKMTMGLFDWAMLGLLGSAVMALTYLRPAIYKHGLYAIMALHMALYALWLGQTAGESALLILGGSAILYCLLPQLLITRCADPRLWCGIQLLAAGALYAIGYRYLEASDNFMAITSLLLAAFSIWQIRYAYVHAYLDDGIKNDITGMYAFAANAFIATGFVILLPDPYLSIAFALQSACALWVYTKTRIVMLDVVAFMLTGLFIFLQHEQLFLFASIIGSSIIDQGTSRTMVQHVLAEPFIGLGLPSIALIVGFVMRTRAETVKNPFIQFIAVAGGAAGLATCYYLIRLMHNGELTPSIKPGFIERANISFMLAAWALCIIKISGDNFRKWGILLFHIFLARIVWFDLLLDNPYLDHSQKVGGLPFFNGITLTYLGAFILTGLAFYKNIVHTEGTRINIYGGLALVFLMAFISLNIRHIFHGDNMFHRNGMDAAELYTYSAIWILTGAGILALGILRQSHILRMASFGVISLTVLKVFLVDAGNLEGLYRVISFAGLGISLIALSYFYTRFVRDDV